MVSEKLFSAVVFLTLAVLLAACKSEAPSKTEPTQKAKTASVIENPDKKVTCPVCGLEFTAKESAKSIEHQGKIYHFFLEDHASAFAESPKEYVEMQKE